MNFKKFYFTMMTAMLAFILTSKAESIVDVVFNSPDHTILEIALIESNLKDDLEGSGSFTLFAPTDDAFNALPDGTLEALLEDSRGALTEILLYHLVSGNILSSDLSDGQIVETFNDNEKTLKITVNTEGVFINESKVTVANIEVDNGVVHVIDAVLIPPTMPETVVDIIVDSESHITLEAAVKAANLVETLQGEGPFTVFAPTDAAFNSLPIGTVNALLDDPSGALTDILLYHVVVGKAMSSDLSDGQMIETVFGEDITVSITADGVYINGAMVSVADLEAGNGVVHVIDAVLLPPTMPATVVDIVVNSDAHNTLEAAVIAAGLAETLMGEGPFTVFAPTDAAFAALPEGTVESLLEDPSGALTDILLYHVVAGKAMSSDLSDGQMIETVFGKDITVSITADGVYINGAMVSVADLEAGNGVVHVIDAVLLPPTMPATVVDIVVNSDAHNTLEAAVIAAGLAETLMGEGPFTVFAPTDAAFAALPEGTVESLLEDPSGALTDILLYHVVAGKAMSSDLSDGQMIETVFGKDITVSITADGVYINGAMVSVADLEAGNGVVHVIDAVLLPPTMPATVVDIVVNSDAHNTLEAAVIAAGLAETLMGEGPFTVFAPTDAAFAALPEGTVESLLEDPSGALTDILLYHVVAGKAMSSDLSDGQMIETVFGKDITVSITADGVYINGAMVSVADLEAGNGVVHVIDAVLLPPTMPATVVDIVVNSDAHNTLEAAVIAAGLAETLMGEGPFSVFAPTDAAFAALPEGTVESLLEDPSGALTDILLYHVVAGKAMSSDLNDGQMIETVFGKDITVSITADGVYINGAMVSVADLEAGNGVVHVIDAVLLPPTMPATVVDIVINSDAHNTLEAAVIAAGLAETLMGEGPFTVFAPTDAAFAALPEGTVESLLEDPSGALTDILLYHVVAGKAMSSDLSDGQMIETVFGKDITVSITADGVYINGAMVSVADLEAGNGVVHVIDAVLLPPTMPATVVDIVVNSDAHNTLEAAVIAAGLAETLMGEGPFTVFAPTDAAFAALPEGTVESLLEDPSGALTDILLYHVVAGKAMSSDLSDGQMIETVFGKDITVSITADGVYINGAMVSVADLEAGNGVVHVIDAVLIPSNLPATVVDIIVESSSHITLESFVKAAELVETLQGDGPFTVFAPTDAAFAALPIGTINALLEDPSGALTDILFYHVVAGKAMSSDLSDGQMIETVLGKDIMVKITEDGVYINDAMVTVADLEADNGVVHVIDAALLPAPDVKLMDSEMGEIITDGFGNTLYFFTKDADGESACEDGCLDNWPIFYANSGDFGEGLNEADFGTIDRGNGVMQTTYKGWPLYYFIKDMEPGQILGDGVIGKWFVAKPDYTIMLTDNQLIGLNGTNYKGDYTEGDEIIQYFTDDKGLTLYTWKNDFYNVNNFTKADFSNDGIWPIYEQDMIVIPSVLNEADFDVIDVHGKNQLTFKGWPLYYFVQDMMTRGKNTGVSVPAPGVWPVAVNDIMEAKQATVVDIVVNSDAHNTLEAAVIAAGLAETLMGEGPFTVFAPTDAAFAALPEGTVESLLEDPSGALTDILLYHVVAGKAMSSDLSDGQIIETVFGKDITVSITADGVYINGAMVSVADLEAGNGVVHVIDAVLLPPTMPATVVDIVVNSDAHNTLEAAVIAAGLAETLMGEGPFTVFAPTDAAFAALPEGTVESLLEDPSGALTDILLYHVVAGKAMSSDLSDGQMIETVFGKDITVSITADGVYINGAMVSVADLEAGNGVVHVIDAVLLPPTMPATVVDIVVNSDAHNTLEAAVIAAGLAETLMGEGPFTVFAPTDAAFAALPEGTVESLLEDPSGALTDILLYHVVAGKAMSSDLSDGQMIETVFGKDITVSITADGVYINGAMVSVADLEAGNGVVHVIDAVLLPPTMPATVVDIVVNSDAHNTLEAAVIAAGLAETLMGEGPFTVFAPTDAAFAALPEGTVESLLEDPSGALTDILLYHVVAGKAMSSDLSDGQMIETVFGKDITVSITADGVYINGAMVSVADLEAGNGVVHVIDAVLLPPTMPATVVDIVVNSDAHNTLEAAVIAAGLAETLMGEGPFTVFAPTDAAFAALPEGTVESLLEDPSGALTDILLYHVVAGKAMSSDLSDGQMIETVFGEDITVSITADGVYINGAMVSVADLEAGNGVVHVIDAVLLPPTMPATVVDIVVNSDAHNTLEAAVIAAGLAETLMGEGPFTVFAPTDAAFAALPEGTVESLLEDPSGALTDILLYHVVAGKAMSSDLSDGQMIETVFGKDITVSITADGVYINGAMVSVADLEAGNGVVHVIDAVLLPPTMPATVVDIVVNSDAHNTLEAAVIAAGLAETLMGEGPFTVFAPTDAAFAALPEGTVESLLEDPSGALTDILLYHVVAGKAMSSDLSDGQMIETVFGKDITVSITADGVYINGAMVSVADLEAGNGVVHVIDAVLLPSTVTSISEIEEISVDIYPNPASDYIRINSNFIGGKASVRDIAGRVVLEVNDLSSTDRIDITELTSGMYLVSVENGASIVTQKLIVK